MTWGALTVTDDRVAVEAVEVPPAAMAAGDALRTASTAKTVLTAAVLLMVWAFRGP